MVRDAFRAGWAGAVLKTTSMEGTPVELAYPMMSSLEIDGRRVAVCGVDITVRGGASDLVEAGGELGVDRNLAVAAGLGPRS